MPLARFIVAWCCAAELPDRNAVMKYCTSTLATLRDVRHHGLAVEVREAIKKGRERYIKDFIKDLSCR
ncbi:MAG: hypothetical protein WC505_06765 [Patescibacteria group bacterium]